MSELLEYKCPCCGGDIEFDPTLQKMKCPYCDTEFDVETLAGYNDDVRSDKTDDIRWESGEHNSWSEDEAGDLRVYVCRSCGGEVVGDETTAAMFCPYCGNPVIMTGNLSGAIKPDIIIPFKLDKKAAKEALSRHLKGKRLLPKVFKSENHIDEIKGVYVPFWLFDADTDASLRYKATTVRMWSDSKYDYTETSYYSVLRSGSVGFENVPVDGSSRMDDALMESIEPFDIKDAVDFNTAYLSGYFADKYDVDAESSIGRANERIKRSTEDAFAETVSGYDTVVTENNNITVKNGKKRYALYPVWLLNTTWRDKKYTFAMNGQTGKFVGDLPVDKAAFARWFASIFALTTAVAFGVSYLLWLM